MDVTMLINITFIAITINIIVITNIDISMVITKYILVTTLTYTIDINFTLT